MHTMKTNYLSNIEMTQPVNVERRLNEKEVCWFGQSIHDHPNIVNTSRSPRQTHQNVHGDMIHFLSRIDNLWNSPPPLSARPSNAGSTGNGTHIVCNISPHTSPHVILSRITIHRYGAWIDRISRIIDLTKNQLRSNPELLEHKYYREISKPYMNLR